MKQKSEGPRKFTRVKVYAVVVEAFFSVPRLFPSRTGRLVTGAMVLVFAGQRCRVLRQRLRCRYLVLWELGRGNLLAYSIALEPQRSEEN